jgi:CPA1 family monovalent cation:H+ antiporter
MADNGAPMTPTSVIQYLLILLVIAATIAILAKRYSIPYTAALVFGGLMLGSIHLSVFSPLQPGHRPDWLTPEVILILFLPALVFEGSIKIDLQQLLRNALPVLFLANAGMLVAAVVTGLVVHWLVGMPILFALIFGAIISATDPISVLAVFKSVSVSKRLALILEGESLLNDGTAVVLFEILIGIAVGEKFSLLRDGGHYFLAVIGGAVLGAGLGYVFSLVTKAIDDPQIELTLTTILCYGSYLLAHRLEVSGVIATACAGIVLGNVGAKRNMSQDTLLAMHSFWEFVSFVMNSLVFLLIGLEIHIGDLWRNSWTVSLAVVAVLLGRALSIYPFVAVSNLFAEKIPLKWQHVFVWGGLRGALALALALSLSGDFPYRDQILDLTFGVVIFSIMVQGLTMKPLVRLLKLPAGPAANPS